MKITFGLWALLFVIGWMTAGFFPALLLLAVGSAGGVSLALHAQGNELGSGSSYKSLR